jgi:hypothetical protein
VTKRERTVLQHLESGGATVDEFLLNGPGVYVNSWAPVFTHLKQRGLIVATDDKRLTRWGAFAHVHEITSAGREALGVEELVAA